MLVTSLMYSTDEFEIEKQRKAMLSWKDAGFSFFSCNIKEEVDLLKSLFPDVEFVILERSGIEITGKPQPYIYDLLQELKIHINDHRDVCGIINSDIFLRGISKEAVKRRFLNNKKKILNIHRYDVEHEKDFIGEYFLTGIDVFFFMPEYIDVFPDEGFLLGRPQWDPWFLLKAHESGLELEEIKNKVAFHIRHQLRWSSADSNRQAQIKVNSDVGDLYFYKTNCLLSNLKYRKEINCNEKEMPSLVKDGNIYWDADYKKLMGHECLFYGESDCFSTVLFFQNEFEKKRICVLHKEYQVLDSGVVMLSNSIKTPLGNPLKYVDIKDLDFYKKLQKVLIYPAGRASRLLEEALTEDGIDVIGFADKDKNLWGTEIQNKKVFPPCVLKDVDSYEYVIVASTMYVSEIYDGLCKVVPKEKLIVL